jgi:acid phosphatase family membrane protein YuiD
MDWLTDLLTNPFLLTSLSSWFIAQVIKVIINAIVNKKIVWERMVGDGGMPSGHSATVSSLAVVTGLAYGFGTFPFALAAVFAIVVCHDATGVRQETGKQAVMLNEIIQILEADDLPEVKLKELVGHTPLQVLAGILIGIGNAFFMYFVVL